MATRVVAERNGDGERITFHFEAVATTVDAARLPGYWVRYTREPIRFVASGEPAAVAGEAVLMISLGLWMYPTDDPSVDWSAPIRPGTTMAIRELLMLGNHEGMTSWAVGLDAEYPFSVVIRPDPPAVTVELPRPPG